jgi:endonuclease/exonuclease/phosphatase (EEP) superfamily protein YafD
VLVGSYGLAAVEFEKDDRKRVFGKPLDHVYVRGLDVVAAETRETASSDHNPMRVWLSIS